MSKVCANRVSKAHPNVYLLSELKTKAVAKGYKKSDVSKMKKEELCKLLKIKWVGDLPKSTTPAKSPKASSAKATTCKATPKVKNAEITVFKRPCGPPHSKNNPDAYTKVELVEKVVKLLGYNPKDATKLTKPNLCKLLSETEEALKNRKSPDKSVDCASRSKLKLKPHQLRVIEHLKTHRGLIVAFGLGSGKTLTAVAAAFCFLEANPRGTVYVAAPATLVSNFRKEMKTYGVAIEPRIKVETFASIAKRFEKEVFPSGSMLIIDEAHELRTDANKSIKVSIFLECASLAKRVLLLTGTPIFNRPEDVLNLVAMVKGSTKKLSQPVYDKMSGDDMCKYFKDTIMYYDPPESSEHFPTIKERKVKITMSPEYYKAYHRVEKGLDKSIADPWIFLTGMRQASNGLIPSPKCQWAIKKIREEVALGKQVLVYSAFLQKGVRLIQKTLDGLAEPIPYAEVTGTISAEKRDRAVSDFNRGKINVLFITKAGGQGIDLKNTRTVIILEKAWNRQTEQQVIGRARRYDSHIALPLKDRHVDVYHLILIKPEKKIKGDTKEKSADVILMDAILKKEKQSAAMNQMLRASSLDSKEKCPPPSFVKEILAPEKKRLVASPAYELKIIGGDNSVSGIGEMRKWLQTNVSKKATVTKLGREVYVSNLEKTDKNKVAKNLVRIASEQKGVTLKPEIEMKGAKMIIVV